MSSTDLETLHPPVAAMRSRALSAGYWTATLFISLTALAAGFSDLLHLQPLYGLLLHLGYPSYFSAILGAWKVLGALALLSPRRPLVKEWAYAGMFIDYSSAIISHLASGDGAVAAMAPAVSLAALVASWYLRPMSARLAPFDRPT